MSRSLRSSLMRIFNYPFDIPAVLLYNIRESDGIIRRMT